MHIFIDIGHPAHVHYFRNFYRIMRDEGHQLLITARDKEMTHALLQSYSIPFVSRGKGGTGAVGKLGYLVKGDRILWREARAFNPDIFLSFSSPYAAQVSSLMRKPHIALDDTEHAWLGRLFYHPFTNAILSPASYRSPGGKKQIKINSFLELLYLHPHYFTPNASVLDTLGVRGDEKFVLLRFVSWQANHDLGHQGLTMAHKRRAVEKFGRHARVFISAEGALPDDLASYRLPTPSNRIHDVIYHAAMLYGESGTMASEAVVLGTPAFFLNDTGLGYTEEQERRYGLVHNYSESAADQAASISKGVEVLQTDRTVWREKRQALLDDTIDPTAYLVWFVENYPESKLICYHGE